MAWKKKGGKDEGPSPEELKNVPAGLDTSTFFSPSIPSEVRAMVPLLHDLPQDTSTQVLHATFQQMMRQQVTVEAVRELQQQVGLEVGVFGVLYSGVYTLLRHIVRHRVKASVLCQDLPAMHVPAPFTTTLLQSLKTHRPSLELQAPGVNSPHTAVFPTLDAMRWRVDVTVSSSSLSKVLKPTIIMQLCLSDGSLKTMEVSVAEFQQLRYKAAKVLHSMKELERHPIMRIVRALDAERKPDTS